MTNTYPLAEKNWMKVPLEVWDSKLDRIKELEEAALALVKKVHSDTHIWRTADEFIALAKLVTPKVDNDE